MKKLFFLITVAIVAYKIAKRLGYMENHPKTSYIMDKISGSPTLNGNREVR